MIARDQCDALDLLRTEAAERPVLDEIVRVPVVAIETDMGADVVQDAGVLEPIALAIAQPVHGPRLVEQRHGEPRHLLGMFRLVVTPLRELDHAPASHIRIALGMLDRRRVALDVVEHQPFPQREIAQRELGSAQPPYDGVQEHGAGDGQVGPAGIEAGQTKPRLQIE